MAKLTLTDISSTYGSIAVQNANNQRIEDAIENTLSRDGSTPNQMLAQLDMNTNRIINLAAPVNANDAVRYIDAQTLNLPEQAGHSGQYLRSNGTLSDWAVPPASEISNTPAGTIVATDVQAALNELDGDVTTHAALTAAHGATGAVVGTTNAQTLTNKTISLTSNTLTGTTAEFNTALSDGDFATLAGTETLTNKTISNGTLSGATTVSGGGTVDGRYIAADGAKLDGIEPFATADQTTEEIQDAAWGGTTLTGTQTGITVTYQDATNDVDFVTDVTLTNSATLTNKTISAGTLSGTTTVSGLLDSSSYFLSTRTLAANTALESKVSGDTGTRFRIGADGKHDWGDATVGGTWDTNLYRSAANVLTTDDSFSVGGSITVTGTVDGRDVSTDGSTLDSHVASTTAHGATGAVVGTTNTQTLTNKTLTTPTLTLKQSAAPAPTAEGDIQWDTDDNKIKIGDGVGTKTFSDDSVASGIHGVTGSIVGTTDTQTLTNKTISADSNTLSGIAASSFVLSNGSGNIDGAAAQKAIPSGVVVGTTDSQTLTNKTLTAPTVSDPTISGAATFSGTIEATGTSHFNIPAGTTAQRPGTPTVGDIRYNSTTGTFEGYKSGSWGTLGGGGAGYGTLNIIRTNPTTIDENITFSTNTNGVTVGPITVSTSYTLDVSASGARLVVL